MKTRTHDQADERSRKPEHEETLWLLTIAPTIWAAHFLASYLTAAIHCAKAGPDAPLGGVLTAIALYTAAALAGIAATARVGYRRHGHGTATVPHDFDTPEDRHRFLGFATLLLSALSAVAVVYVAIAAAFFRSCR